MSCALLSKGAFFLRKGFFLKEGCGASRFWTCPAIGAAATQGTGAATDYRLEGLLCAPLTAKSIGAQCG